MKIDNLLVKKTNNVKEAMAVIDKNALGIAFIVDNESKFIGLITDGDIRRAILKGENIESFIEKIANTSPIVMKEGEIKRLGNVSSVTAGEIKEITLYSGSLKVPELDKEDKIKGIKFIDPNTFKLKLENKAVKKILIIGGAGYLGSVLSKNLLKSGYKIRILDNLTYTNKGIKELSQNRNFEFIKGDIRDISIISEAIETVDAVIHLAAIVGDPASAINPKRTIEVNYLSTKAIAEVCRFNQINRFLFASTCSVYGKSENSELLREDSELNPVSLYARMKLESEKGVFTLCDSNFSPTIFRFATLYGVSPRMRFDLVVNLLTLKALKDKKITIFGGEQWRPNLEVSDAALAIKKWLEAPIEIVRGEIFNIGDNSQNYRIIEIGNIIKKIIPEAEMEIRKEEGDIRNYNVCFDKALDILNFVPQKIIEDGILEIKKFIENKKIKDFNISEYNNYDSLLKEIKKI